MSFKTQLNGETGRGARSGVARCGENIFKGTLVAGVLLAFGAALIMIACGGSSSSSSPTSSSSGTGGLYTFITDTPACDLLGFSVFPSEMDLHQAGNPPTSLTTVWPTNVSLTSPAIEMSTLRDTMTVANLTSLPSGTYDQAILRVVSNGASIFDPTQSPPASKYDLKVTTANVTINLQPPLVITSGKISAIELDLNLPLTLGMDSQGQLNGTVNWAFTARSLAASSSTGFGEMDDLHGIVRSVNPSISGSTFKSSFLLQTLAQTATSPSGGGPALTVYLNDKTNLCVAGTCNTPLSEVDQVPTGSYVEVDGYVDENGNLVASTIQVEDREFVDQQLLGYVGPVLDVTKDGNGSVTHFDMLARETNPSRQTEIPIFSVLSVNVSSSTTFNSYLVSSDLASLASSGNLALDATTLAPGQEVVVHGVYSKPSAGPITVDANSVYPRLQSVQGTFSSLVGTPGSDNKTGAFQMTPCAGLLGNNPFMVVTDGQTNFVNTSGLNALSSTSPLMVRGLLFLNLQNTTIQGTGTSVPAGTMVLLAKHVRQF